MARLQVGYYRSLANFLTFSLLMFTISLAMSSHFRLLALLAPDETIAYPLGSLLSLALVITSGFTITRGGRSGPAGGLCGERLPEAPCTAVTEPAAAGST